MAFGRRGALWSLALLRSRLPIFFFPPETMAGLTDEHILKRGLADRDRLNFAGEGFHQIGHEPVAFFALHADSASIGGRADAEFGGYARGQRFRVAGFKHDHVAADFPAQGLRRSQGHNLALAEDCAAVAMLGLFPPLGGYRD